MLWGYFFLDTDMQKLKTVAKMLEEQGYTFVDIFEADKDEGSNIQEYYLQMEKVERHNLNSLMQRNNQFYELAIQQGIGSYDGFDVGHVES